MVRSRSRNDRVFVTSLISGTFWNAEKIVWKARILATWRGDTQRAFWKWAEPSEISLQEWLIRSQEISSADLLRNSVNLPIDHHQWAWIDPGPLLCRKIPIVTFDNNLREFFGPRFRCLDLWYRGQRIDPCFVVCFGGCHSRLNFFFIGVVAGPTSKESSDVG